MTAQHTQLPWILESIPDLEDGENIEIYDKDGFPIAKIEGSPVISKWSERFPGMQHWADGAEDGRTQRERSAAEILANAHLFLAAPDLLATLERLLDSQRGLNIQEWQQAVADGRAAIAKARGPA